MEKVRPEGISALSSSSILKLLSVPQNPGRSERTVKAKKCQCICFSLNSGTAQEKLCSGGLKVERGSVSQRGGRGACSSGEIWISTSLGYQKMHLKLKIGTFMISVYFLQILLKAIKRCDEETLLHKAFDITLFTDLHKTRTSLAMLKYPQLRCYQNEWKQKRQFHFHCYKMNYLKHELKSKQYCLINVTHLFGSKLTIDGTGFFSCQFLIKGMIL